MQNRVLASKLRVSSAVVIAIGACSNVLAADAPIDEIIVTARRVEESLQDVPISITVFNAQQLSDRNVAVATDLAAYTPSLSVNQRYGPEKASFAIRGFNQDQSTAPTVGVYFADVVGIRAQGGTTSGNTVGAGAFTDLQNVQVLKGPQGTLFGRNTTGGAVLLVPQKPTNDFGGYVEGTAGNFDERRVQAALNVPVSDAVRMRFSVDSNQRDGFMENHSGIGPDDYNDINYIYGRLSIVADLTPNVEDYLIVHYSDSDTNAFAARQEVCNPNIPAAPTTLYATSQASCDQIARQAARGDGKLDVDINFPDPQQKLKTWQAINTTTWRVTDDLTVKNIASYGEFTERSSFSLNSDNYFVPNTAVTQGAAFRTAGWQPGQRFQYIGLDTSPGEDSASESTWTEELQLQGTALDSKFTWVTGAYLEYSRPLGWSAARTSIYAECADASNIICTEPLGFGLISASRTQIKFDNTGYFAQGTYKFSDKFALTVGGRYTSDKIEGESESYRYTLLPSGARILSCNDARVSPNPASISQCHVEREAKSSKPTWLIDFDYKPTDDLLLYAKWARGYRQGGLSFTNPGLETWEPESVDAYELGAKTGLPGGLTGYFNVAAFYNDFTDQQIFASGVAKPGSGIAGGAPIINAGRSEIYGIEVDTSVSPLEHLRFDLNYTYLETKLKELVAPTLDPTSPFLSVTPNGTIGSPLTQSPNNKASLNGTYTLPLDEAIGVVSFGATYVYTDKQILSANSPIGVAPPSKVLNANLNWNSVMGSPVDIAAFVTNATNEIYRVAVGQIYSSAGFENALYAPPRIWGVRVKYSFGQ
jgi:iron complex outermembrane receptor protein